MERPPSGTETKSEHADSESQGLAVDSSPSSYLIIGRIVLFVLLTVLLAFGNPLRLGRSIVGNPGDAYLIMSILEWGADRSVALFSGYWDGPMFAQGHNVMAYTDTFLPLVVPFKIIEVTTGSRVLAFNLLYLASWVLCAEATYRLALRFVTSRGAAAVASIAFTFSTIRVAQGQHFQLAWAGLIPLTLLLCFRLRESPTPARGALVACAVVLQLLTSAYYGVVLIVAVGVFLVAVGVLGLARRDRAAVTAHATAVGVLAASLLPIRHWYAVAQEGATVRAEYPAPFALSLGDLRSPSPTSTFLRWVPFLDTDTAVRSSENYAYVGIFALVFAPLFVVLCFRRQIRIDRWGEVLSISALGAFALTIALGRGPVLGVRQPLYDVYAAVIPGLDSIVALVRMFVFVQLALAIVASIAFSWTMSRLPDRRWRAALTTALVVCVAIEGSMTQQMADVVEVRPGTVYAIMQDLEAGVAVELPMGPRSLGSSAYTEATRMMLGANDGIQLVNGYSGLAPVDYAATVDTLNQFPSAASIDELRRLDVRYVVIHTAPLETGLDIVTLFVNQSGYTYAEPDEVMAILETLPPEFILGRIDGSDGFVLEIAADG